MFSQATNTCHSHTLTHPWTLLHTLNRPQEFTYPSRMAYIVSTHPHISHRFTIYKSRIHEAYYLQIGHDKYPRLHKSSYRFLASCLQTKTHHTDFDLTTSKHLNHVKSKSHCHHDQYLASCHQCILTHLFHYIALVFLSMGLQPFQSFRLIQRGIHSVE